MTWSVISRNQPIGARPDSVAYRTAKFVKRHARAVATAAGVVVLIAVLVGFYTARLAAERDRAHGEAEKSAKVSELMTELLTGADPYGDRPNPTVRDVLDAGAARVQTELAGEPEVLAEMLTVIGRVYQRLEIFDKAQPMLEQALALGRGVGGPEHPRVAQTLNDLGVLMRMNGNARRLAEDAGGIARDAAAAPWREAQGHRRDALRARPLVPTGSGSAIAQKDSPATPSPCVASCLETITARPPRAGGTSGCSSGSEAISRRPSPCFVRASRSSRKALGDQHPNVSSALSNLGLVVADRGNYAEAETLFREALAVRRKAMGQSHASLAVPLNNLAYPLREQGKYDEAVAALEEALALSVRAIGEDSPTVAHYRANLSRVYLAKGDAAQAVPLLRQSLAARLRAFGEDDWRVGMTKSLLGSALTSLERYDEAERLLLDARRLLKDVPGAQGREARATVTRLQTFYRASGRPDKAAEVR